jgi:hypothetical protein
MARSKPREVATLASRWSPPDGAGQPLACVATTYTFHAPLFEGDLLPRFLGLKFDATEGERPFFVEREQALGTSRAAVLVDQDHVDPSQATLRWDQLAVRVPGGVQHAKLTLLAWERCVRLMIGSANLTRTGYRRNRETVACLDFHDDPSSAPRRLALDALDFLGVLLPWSRGTAGAVWRLRDTLAQTRELLGRWRAMPDAFTPNEMPRAHLFPCLPAQGEQARRSPLDEALALWGGRRANEVVVMTPFVGEDSGERDPVVERLTTATRSRDTVARLVVPGQPSQEDPQRLLVHLPRRFRDAWARAWGIDAKELLVHVVPPCRPGEKYHRELHAKGVLLVGDNTSLLLCGSSNFSPHGMGVDAANVEANLCFLARTDEAADGLRLRDRLTDRWEEDEAERTTWPDEAKPPEDEAPGAVLRLPAVFLWAALDQRDNTLTLGLDPLRTLPRLWSIRLTGERARELPPLASQADVPSVPEAGRVTVPLPDELRQVTVACLAVHWTTDDGEHQALLPVQVERAEDLLPPEEFRAISADAIISCLLSGREPAELVEQMERQGRGPDQPSTPVVDTSGYALYRVRRLGRALATLGERLLRTVRTREATTYRLGQDPLGPCALAEALVREWGSPSEQDRSALRFALAEVCLTLAHVARRVAVGRQEAESDLAPLYADAIQRIGALGAGLAGCGNNLEQYVAAVDGECQRLVGAVSGESHAG